jgi:hypothetical protein
MSRTSEDIELYLTQLGRTFDRQGLTFVVSTGPSLPPVALHVADPVVVARVVIGSVPKDPARQLGLLRQLLVYNATDLVHASYGLDAAGQIVLAGGQELENMDLNELSATLSDLDLALSSHVPKLRELAKE